MAGPAIKTKPLPSQAELLEALDYNPETGVLTWRFRKNRRNCWNSQFAGKTAFTAMHQGYHFGQFNCGVYFAHRLIWKMVYNEDPPQLDHINGRRADNRISNLKVSNRIENSRNQKLRADNKSGVCGVRLDQRTMRWKAEIGINRKTVYLGTYEVLEDAIKARKAASTALGFSERHGT